VRQQPGSIIPILGARTVEQLQDNRGCLDFQLTSEQRASLAEIAGFKPGFPNGFLHSDHVRGLIFGEAFARLDWTGMKAEG
jgi:diketogulonate reductase-like aldo/keto reductase